ncbi:MAG TPA: hypothetical protein VJ867_14940 [Gemmatimonadaceae bacterium]|nr:hypothetical protein [Gemmatimonadaceae bacterium]
MVREPGKPPSSTQTGKSLVTRAALERVLARAAELQAETGDDSDLVDAPDALTEQQILDVGKEVGLSSSYIRQALAEERARIEALPGAASGVASHLFGGTRVAVQRVVPGAAERVLATLDRWMQREEWLRVVRQRADRIIWEPRRGLLSSVRQLLRGRDYALYRANDIAATVIRMDDASTLVRLEADFTVLRRTMVGQTGAGTVVGTASSVALVAMGVMMPVAVAPALLIAGASYATSRRTQAHALQRAQLTLEHVLDRLEQGDATPPTLLRLIEAALPPNP